MNGALTPDTSADLNLSRASMAPAGIFSPEQFAGKPVLISLCTQLYKESIQHRITGKVLNVGPLGVVVDVAEHTNNYSNDGKAIPKLSGITMIPWQSFSIGGSIGLKE